MPFGFGCFISPVSGRPHPGGRIENEMSLLWQIPKRHIKYILMLYVGKLPVVSPGIFVILTGFRISSHTCDIIGKWRTADGQEGRTTDDGWTQRQTGGKIYLMVCDCYGVSLETVVEQSQSHHGYKFNAIDLKRRQLVCLFDSFKPKSICCCCCCCRCFWPRKLNNNSKQLNNQLSMLKTLLWLGKQLGWSMDTNTKISLVQLWKPGIWWDHFSLCLPWKSNLLNC